MKNLDSFGKNLLVVFAGTSFLNALNLVFQLLIAHQLSPAAFAAFNALIALFMLVSGPLTTFQSALAKAVARARARGRDDVMRHTAGFFLTVTALLGVATGVAGTFLLPAFLAKLRIPLHPYAELMALLLASTWVTPVVMGLLQGREMFAWMTGVSALGGILKLGLAAVFLWWGLAGEGAMAALVIATFAGVAVGAMPLRNKVAFNWRSEQEWVPARNEALRDMAPILLAMLCFNVFISVDMMAVKYYFTPERAGDYALAQMVGKIFLFLPGAISIVMFPKTAGESAIKCDPRCTLFRSLKYAAMLCGCAVVVYNIVPEPMLRLLTGKATASSILLGRFFSVSLSLYALSYIVIMYFLSVGSRGFLAFAAAAALLQITGFALFHAHLVQIQAVMCTTAAGLLAALLVLVYRHRVVR